MSIPTIQWSGYEWYMHEHWGQVRPDQRWLWMDPSAISVDDNGYLHLVTKYNPKLLSELMLPEGIIPQPGEMAYNAQGLLSSTTQFYHGTYEIEAKLPKGKFMWPAFWTWGWNNWPPEIDVLEAYSNKYGNYFWFNFDYGGLSIWKVLATVHWRTGGPNNNSAPRTAESDASWFGYKNPANRFMKYKLEWFPDAINVYYDGYLVKSWTDPAILAFVNQENHRVIINSGLTQRDDDTDSDFVVKYFTYQSI